MAQPTNFTTSNINGVDLTTYYANVIASVATYDPSVPGIPFAAGTQVQGSGNSEFVLVQASTTINFGDFVSITYTNTANSATSTTVLSSNGSQIGFVGPTVRQSVTYIPVGAYFWAQTNGTATTTAATYNVSPAAYLGGGPVYLYTGATAGLLTSTSVTTAAGIAGVIVLTSTSTAINPVYLLGTPRAITVFSSAGAQQSANSITG